MAVQLLGGRPRRGGKFRNSYRPLSEINVTPFVDVMLVLLIVFMVTAPLLSVGVPVDLPQTQANNLPSDDKPLVVSVDAAGDVFIQEVKVSLDQLVPKLKAVTGANPDAKIYVRGDQSIDYGRIMKVMGQINSSGFKRVSLVAQLPNNAQTVTE